MSLFMRSLYRSFMMQVNHDCLWLKQKSLLAFCVFILIGAMLFFYKKQPPQRAAALVHKVSFLYGVSVRADEIDKKNTAASDDEFRKSEVHKRKKDVMYTSSINKNCPMKRMGHSK